MNLEFKRGLSHRLAIAKNCPATWTIVGVLLAIQALLVFAGGHREWPAVYETLGLSRNALFTGKFWQPATYALLHGNGLHVAINGLALWLLGSKIEYMLGRARLLRSLAFGILGGAAGHLALEAGDRTLVGASGGIMALLLLLTTLSPESRMWPLPLSGRNLGAGLLMAALALALANPSAGMPGFERFGQWLERHGMGSWFDIGHACHFGGGVAGWIYGRWILRPRITKESLQRSRERQEAKARREAGR